MRGVKENLKPFADRRWEGEGDVRASSGLTACLLENEPAS